MPKKVRFKKILAAVLALVTIVAAVPFVSLSAFAVGDSGTFSITADKDEIYSGDTVTFTVYMNGVATNGMEFDLEYDSSALSFVDAEITALDSSAEQTSLNPSDGKISFTAYDVDNAINEVETKSTAVAKVKFTVYSESDFDLNIVNPNGDEYVYIGADNKVNTVSYEKTYTKRFSITKTDGAIRLTADKESLVSGEKTTVSIYFDCKNAPVNNAIFSLDLSDGFYIEGTSAVTWNESLSFISNSVKTIDYVGAQVYTIKVSNNAQVLNSDNILIAKVVISKDYNNMADSDENPMSGITVSQSVEENSFNLTQDGNVTPHHYSAGEYYFNILSGEIAAQNYYISSDYNDDANELLAVGDSFTVDFYVDAARYPSNEVEVVVYYENACLEISDIKWNVPAKQRKMNIEQDGENSDMAVITMKDDENFVADSDNLCLFTLTYTVTKNDLKNVYDVPELWEYGVNTAEIAFSASFNDTITNKYTYYDGGMKKNYISSVIKVPAPAPTVYSVFVQEDTVEMNDEVKAVVSFNAPKAGVYSFDICYDSDKLSLADSVVSAQEGVTVTGAVNSTDSTYGDGYSYITVSVNTGKATSGALVNAYFTAVRAGDAKIIVYPKNGTGIASSASTVVTVDGETVWGDVNGSGALTQSDIDNIKSYVEKPALLVDESVKKLADVNLDGKVTLLDYILLNSRVNGDEKALPCEFGYNEKSEIPDDLFPIAQLNGKLYKNSTEITGSMAQTEFDENDEITVSMSCGAVAQMSALSCWGFYVEYNPDILSVAGINSSNACVSNNYRIVKDGLVYVYGCPNTTQDDTWNGNIFDLNFTVKSGASDVSQASFACYVDVSETVYKDTSVSIYKYQTVDDSLSVIGGYYGNTAVRKRWQETAASVADVVGVTINNGESAVNSVVGKSVYLAVNKNPINSADVDVMWVSSNPAVAVVKDGVVTCVSSGIAKITAVCTSVANGDRFIASVTVNVRNPVTEKNIFVNTTDNVAPDIAKSNLVQTGVDTYSLTFSKDFGGSADLAKMFSSTGDGFSVKISVESSGSIGLNDANQLVCLKKNYSTATKLKVEIYGYDAENGVTLVSTKYVNALSQSGIAVELRSVFARTIEQDNTVELGKKLYKSLISVYTEYTDGTISVENDWAFNTYGDVIYNEAGGYFEFPQAGKYTIEIIVPKETGDLMTYLVVTVCPTLCDGFEILNGVLRSSSMQGVDNAVIDIPNGVKEIRSSFFDELGENVTLNIPASVEKIDFAALREMSSAQLNFADGANFVVIDGVIYDRNMTVAYLALSDCTEFIAPSTLREIYDGAFSNSNVADVDLGKATGLKKIGSDAFAYCTWLKDKSVDVVLYDGVKEIGERAFYSAQGITVSCYINSYAYSYACKLGYGVLLKNTVLGNVTGTESQPSEEDAKLLFKGISDSIENDVSLFANEKAADINGDGEYNLLDVLAFLLMNKR